MVMVCTVNICLIAIRTGGSDGKVVHFDMDSPFFLLFRPLFRISNISYLAAHFNAASSSVNKKYFYRFGRSSNFIAGVRWRKFNNYAVQCVKTHFNGDRSMWKRANVINCKWRLHRRQIVIEANERHQNIQLWECISRHILLRYRLEISRMGAVEYDNVIINNRI